MKLVLWDIDHTLINTSGVGRELFGACFERVTGRRMTQQALVDGMTEQTIFHETARLHGIDSDRALFDRFAHCSAHQHRLHAAELRQRGHALPGAAAALAAVAALDTVVQNVVTGNIRQVAEIKLGVFGLDTHIHFPYGGYGEDSDIRAELVRIAIKRASQALNTDITADDVLLVGDTPADVAAGHANNTRVLAVASGRSNTAVLRNAGATTTIPSLRNLKPLLQALS